MRDSQLVISCTNNVVRPVERILPDDLNFATSVERIKMLLELNEINYVSVIKCKYKSLILHVTFTEFTAALHFLKREAEMTYIINQM